MGKVFLKQVRPFVSLFRDPTTGIAWVEDGTTGSGYSCHPNIDSTGSVAGMKKLHWGDDAEIVRSHGTIYCVNRFAASDPQDYIAALHCTCGGKHAIDTEAFLSLIGYGYYDGPHGPDAFRRDVLTHYLGVLYEANRGVVAFDALLAEHRDLVDTYINEHDGKHTKTHGFALGVRSWLEEVLGEFVKTL